jgi:pimeloyl-ACP methyl ester carboxylesterase/DNA-binding CsgD family transcriptional regulator
MTATETRYAPCAGGSVAYQIIGSGERDIVFVPCWLSHIDRLRQEPRFESFIQSLSAHGRVILFDKRGTGLSDPAPAGGMTSLEARMEELLAVLDAAGSTQAHLVGVGIGGRLSALFAASHPKRVAGLALIGASARGSWAPDYPYAPTQEEHAERMAYVQRTWGGPVWIDSYAGGLFRDESFCNWWAGCLRSAGGPSAAVAMLRLNAESDIRPVLGSIQTPTVVLHRSGDRIFTVEEGRYLAQHIPGAHWIELSGDEHLPFVGDVQRILSELEHFITGARPGPVSERLLATVAVVQITGMRNLAARLTAERWEEVRLEFRAAVRECRRQHKGRGTSVSNHGISAIFDGPARAVNFAEELVERARRLGLRASAGVHTGDVVVTGDQAGGAAPELATRIASLAKTGEVLVSGTLAGLVAGSGLRFTEHPADQRPGLPDSLRLYRVASDEAEPAHPRPHMNPADANPLVALTPREREIAPLLAQGLSNREISDVLSISVSTVERHVANMLTKLGYRSRAQIAAWAVGQMAPRPIGARPLAVPVGLTSAAAD